MPPWGDASDAGAVESGGQDAQPAPVPFAVGDVIFSGSSPEPGTVVAVDADQVTMAVKWRDVGGPILYPLDATFLRKAMPWEPAP